MLIKVKVDGTWRSAATKVKVAGTWQAAYSRTKVSGTWRRDAQDFDLSPYNTNPWGIAWDGAYFYVVDYSDDKMYVYDADGNHQSDRDFDLHADNISPRGIAWDGAYFYVVENRIGILKVYVYDADGTHVG